MSADVLAEWPFSFHIKEAFDGGCLEVTSKDIFIEGANPSIALVYTRDNGVIRVVLKFTEEELQSNLDYIHPHISDNTLCLGDLSTNTNRLATALSKVFIRRTFLGKDITCLDTDVLSEFQRNNDYTLEQYYEDYEDVLQVLLNTYNAGSPYYLFHLYYLDVFKHKLKHPTTKEDFERIRMYLKYIEDVINDGDYEISRYTQVNRVFPNLVIGGLNHCDNIDCSCSCCNEDCDCEETHNYSDEHGTCEECRYYDDGDCEDRQVSLNSSVFNEHMERIDKSIAKIDREHEVKEVLSSLGYFGLSNELMTKLGGLLGEDINF